jgi:Prenyltransferase and squalene oxidase repeat
MFAITVAIHLLAQAPPSHRPAVGPAPEQKAVAFLSREVPRWSRQKHCFSCHNNGDAARALFRAAQAGIPVANDALADTTLWLQKPEGWNHNGGEGPFSDKRLARVAFTTALATAVSTGHVKDRKALLKAAELLTLDQAADGSWPLEGEDAASAPATYGRPLTTLLARESLAIADPDRFRSATDRADNWLHKRKVQNVTDASVSLLAFANATRRPPAENQNRALDLLAHAQSQDGGWGTDAFSPPESFDTALALLALSKCEPTASVKTMIARGRKFLIREQLDDGSWVGMIRPPGNVSYAERISTAGWATMALLATRQP